MKTFLITLASILIGYGLIRFIQILLSAIEP